MVREFEARNLIVFSGVLRDLCDIGVAGADAAGADSRSGIMWVDGGWSRRSGRRGELC